MGVTDAPTWLLPAFVRSCRAVGATAPREDIEAVGRRLIARWQEPVRRFHDLRHVVDVLARVDELAEETHRPDVVRLAAWYHGAVFSSAARKAYARSGGEDEVASAELAREELTALGVPDKITERVHQLIINLRRHDADTADVDCLALCDADLATLAVEPQRYQDYRRAVREEYAHIPQRDYLQARIAIVTRLLARRNLFQSPMGAQWEATARENLTAELNRLHSALAKLPPEEEGSADRSADTELAAPPGAGSADEGTATPTDGTEQAGAALPAEAAEARAVERPQRRDEPRPEAAEREHRPSSLESVPEELAARQQPRTVGYSDPGRARRAERARIAEQGRQRVEQAMKERHRGDARETPPPARASDVPAPEDTPPTGASPQEATAPVRSGASAGTGPATAASPAGPGTPDQVGTPAVPGAPDPAGTPVSAATPADAHVHSMERDPDLLGRVRRKRKTSRRRSTDAGPETPSTGPLLRGPDEG